MFTWSENPKSDLWNHIKFFSNEHNCRKLLKGEIKGGRSLIYSDSPKLEKKVKQITMCLKQATEYFAAADEVSINTSPLLLFYGMLSLAKALIVSNKEEIFLEDVCYHGLETRPRTEELRIYHDNPTSWSMEEEYAVTNNGVFKYLSEVVGKGIFEDGSVIRFKDILSICPEISEIYEKYYNEPAKVLYLYSFHIISDLPRKFKIAFLTKYKAEVYKRFPKFMEDFDVSQELLDGQAIEFISHEFSVEPDYFSLFNPLVGGQYVVSGLNYKCNDESKNKVISQVSLDYLAMFILSICVRYKQDFWGLIINGEKSGILGLVELYISVVKRRYPNFILNLLVGENFDYGSPARYM